MSSAAPSPVPGAEPGPEPPRPPEDLLGVWLARRHHGRGRRWWNVVLTAFVLLQLVTAVVDGSGLRLAVWGVLGAGLGVALLMQRRVGTQVLPEGLRSGDGFRWRPLVAWRDVELVRVQQRYGRSSSVLVDGRSTVLHGLRPEEVRRVAAALGLLTDDPDGDRRSRSPLAGGPSPAAPAGAAAAGAVRAGATDALGDADLDGPFRSGRRPSRPEG